MSALKPALILGILLMFVDPVSAVQQPEAGDFYSVMSSGNLGMVNNFLVQLRAGDDAQNRAMKGAMLMKKAGLLSNSQEKISNFKEGRVLLEKAIAEDSSRVEFRFMRLMVQENSPPALKYKNAIDPDSYFIATNFKRLSGELKKAVRDYSKTSQALGKKILNE